MNTDFPDVAQCLEDSMLIDVDFSEWDKLVRLVVRTEDMPTTGYGGDPVYAVEFRGVREIAFKFKQDLPPMISGQHHGWRINGLKIEPQGLLNRLTTSSEFGSGPSMLIVYETAGCVLVPQEILSRLSPRDAPPAAFERRSLFGLYEVVRQGPRK